MRSVLRCDIGLRNVSGLQPGAILMSLPVIAGEDF